METGIVEGLGKFDIDGAADGASRQCRVRRLHHIHLADEIRADGAEIEDTAGGAGNLAAIVKRFNELGTQAANGDLSGVAGGGPYAAHRGGAAANGDARHM